MASSLSIEEDDDVTPSVDEDMATPLQRKKRKVSLDFEDPTPLHILEPEPTSHILSPQPTNFVPYPLIMPHLPLHLLTLIHQMIYMKLP